MEGVATLSVQNAHYLVLLHNTSASPVHKTVVVLHVGSLDISATRHHHLC